MTTAGERSVLINGLSIGTGGGYTVGREVARYVAEARPDWRVTLAVIRGHRLQSEFEAETLPANVGLLWTPEANASVRARGRYERGELTERINGSGGQAGGSGGHAGYDAVFQLNGMTLPGLRPPTFAHFQDPFPYRTEAWSTLRDRATAWLKRRGHRHSLKNAAVCGWTSGYLESLICGHHGTKPARSVVMYNGVPDDWVERAAGELPEWGSRPWTLVTVGNVWKYKRQSTVIEALAKVRQTPGLEALEYRIIGACPDDYRAELERLAASLGVGEAVHVEGRVADDEVQRALATARAMPLMSVCESFGIPTIEAMAYGTPVVVADCCALPEVCDDAAIVTPVDDVGALANNLRALLTDPERVDQLRRRGAERVAAFQWRKIGARMADEIETMIGATR